MGKGYFLLLAVVLAFFTYTALQIVEVGERIVKRVDSYNQLLQK